MALIFFGKTKCAICSVVINESDDIVATSHFIADPGDPLCPFSDSPIHRSCFLEWDQRRNFVKKFNDTVGGVTFGNGTSQRMRDDGEIVVEKKAER